MTKQYNKLKYLQITSLLLAIAGSAVSLYSAHSHYKNYTDPLYSSFCALSQTINCDTVAQSHWSIFFEIPVAWWGFLFYLFFLLLLLTENYKSVQAWQRLLYISLAASAGTLALAGIAVWKIKSLCLVCLTIYAITFALTYIYWIGRRRASEAAQANKQGLSNQREKKKILRNYGMAGTVFLIGLLLLHFFLPRYWEISSSATDIDNLPQKLADKTGLDINELASALTHPDIKEMLRRDIWRGMKLGITGTPAFLIDGKVYQGHIPAKIFEKIALLPER
jgi:uncharacterized membrane protein